MQVNCRLSLPVKLLRHVGLMYIPILSFGFFPQNVFPELLLHSFKDSVQCMYIHRLQVFKANLLSSNF